MRTQSAGLGAHGVGGRCEDARIRLLGAHGGRKNDRIQEAGQSQLVEHERQQVAVVAEDANAHPRRSDHVNGRPGIRKHPGRKCLGQFGGHVVNVETHGARIAKLFHVDTGVGELEPFKVLRSSHRAEVGLEVPHLGMKGRIEARARQIDPRPTHRVGHVIEGRGVLRKVNQRAVRIKKHGRRI